MHDEITLSGRCAESGLLDGVYDCVDRLVLNAYMPMGHSPGGFRVWWRRWHGDSDDDLDKNHLMRLAGRFARRVRAWGDANGVPVIDCERGVRKHGIAEQYLAEHPDLCRGVFMVLVAKAPATVWHPQRSRDRNVLVNLAKKQAFVNHYSFHILDPDWGHVTIKMSGHPPWGAQIILNGHEHVEAAARAVGLTITKEGNCFTAIDQPDRLAQLADTLSSPTTTGQLERVCDRWIYTACLCFGLDRADQDASRFRYQYSIYQAEYSRNLLFIDGTDMDALFDRVATRTQAALDVPKLRKIFGTKSRPHRRRKNGRSTLSTAIETPTYDMAWLKVTFGLLGVKAYTKGERVLRIEATVHNTRELRCGKVIDRFGDIADALHGIADRFDAVLDCVDVVHLPDGFLSELPSPTVLGATRVGGLNINQPRVRNLLAAATTLAAAPRGFSVADLAIAVRAHTGQEPADYTIRQAAYDLRRLRAKNLVQRIGTSRRYQVPADAARTMCGLHVLLDHVIAPMLAGVRSPKQGRRPAHWTQIDRDYETIRIDMHKLFDHLGLDLAA